MPTEVRDNKQGQKNSPKGKNESRGAADGKKQGALLHGHGKNEAREKEPGSDSKAPESRSGESRKSGG